MNEHTTQNADQNVRAMLLEQTSQSMRSAYTVIGQWCAMMLTAWAALLALGLQADPRSGALMLLSGVVLIGLFYELNRAGQTLSALVSVALALERDLGIPITRSQSLGWLSTFRSAKDVQSLYELSKMDDEEEWLLEVRRGHKYAIFHIRRSRTTLVLVVVGVLQTVAVTFLLLRGQLQP